MSAPLPTFRGEGAVVRRSVAEGSGGVAAAAARVTSAPIALDVAALTAGALLDRVHAQFVESPGWVDAAMYELQEGLADLRVHADPSAWQEVIAQCRRHPLATLIWQDPFTRRSYEKPRGYSGDAGLLDFLYGIAPPPPETTPVGEAAFHHMMAQAGALSVRARGGILARMIDDTADAVASPRILSVACGHLRELAASAAVREGRVGELVALDQDELSLAEVARAYAGTPCVRPTCGSVRDLLARKVPLSGFHFVYAAGLYDYLSERVAARLTRLMFDMLAPGGRLVVANFAYGLPETGYMEAFMDWSLLYRTPQEVAGFSADIADDEWASHRLFWDAPRNVMYLELVKA